VTPAHLNWGEAEVKDSKLAVKLEGEIPTGWKQSFETTVRLLGGGEWGKVQLKKRSVQVNKVSAGSEEKLRHFLESVVEQANADHPPKEQQKTDEPEREKAADDDDGGPDAEMTERFRSFAQPDGESEQQDSGEPGGGDR
jgi:hypothetical protein